MFIFCHFPLQYDVNHDGLLEFLLTTTDAELVFVQTDNTLLHGEAIKVRPGMHMCARVSVHCVRACACENQCVCVCMCVC